MQKKKRLVRQRPELAYEHSPLATKFFIAVALILAAGFLLFGR